MVEFAVFLPILFLLFVGIVDFGMGFWNQLQVNAAAQDGAAYAVVNGFNAANITSAVTRGTTCSTTTICATPVPKQWCAK